MFLCVDGCVVNLETVELLEVGKAQMHNQDSELLTAISSIDSDRD